MSGRNADADQLSLWFIRDLMVLVVFSPLVYAMVRYLRQYALALLGFLWLIYDGVSSPGLSPTAWFFFSLGAFYSVHRRNFVVETRPLLRGRHCFMWFWL